MKKQLVFLGMMLVSAAAWTLAQQQAPPIYLNYFAVGDGKLAPDGTVKDGWETTLLFFNNSRVETKISGKIFDNTGEALILTLRGDDKKLTLDDKFEITLKGNGAALLNLAKDGSLKSGYLKLFEAPQASTASLVLKLYKEGRVVALAGIQPPANSVKEFSFLHTVLDNQNTGLALLNPGTEDAIVTAVAYNPTGNVQLLGGLNSFPLKKNQVVALFITELLPGLFDPKGIALGKIVVTSDRPVIPLVLLTKHDPGGEFQISTLAIR